MGLFDFLRGRKAATRSPATSGGIVQQAVKPGTRSQAPDFGNVGTHASSTAGSSGAGGGGAGGARPDFGNVRSAVASTAPAATPAGGAQGMARQSPGSAGGDGAETYTVKPGDTLSKIAKHFYGDANAYPTIFEANRTLLDDPDKIFPGQVLKIPAKR